MTLAQTFLHLRAMRDPCIAWDSALVARTLDPNATLFWIKSHSVARTILFSDGSAIRLSKTGKGLSAHLEGLLPPRNNLLPPRNKLNLTEAKQPCRS